MESHVWVFNVILITSKLDFKLPRKVHFHISFPVVIRVSTPSIHGFGIGHLEAAQWMVWERQSSPLHVSVRLGLALARRAYFYGQVLTPFQLSIMRSLEPSLINCNIDGVLFKNLQKWGVR